MGPHKCHSISNDRLETPTLQLMPSCKHNRHVLTTLVTRHKPVSLCQDVLFFPLSFTTFKNFIVQKHRCPPKKKSSPPFSPQFLFRSKNVPQNFRRFQDASAWNLPSALWPREAARLRHHRHYPSATRSPAEGSQDPRFVGHGYSNGWKGCPFWQPQGTAKKKQQARRLCTYEMILSWLFIS